METEEQIIYDLLSLINKGELNDDNRIEERLLRTFLRTYRADILFTRYYRGETIPDKYYQTILLERLIKYDKDNLYHYNIPNIINNNNKGLIIKTSMGNIIPLLDSEEFDLSRKNILTQYKAKAYMKDNMIYIYPGKITNNIIEDNNPLRDIISSINKDKIYFRAILHNPSDAPNYDWTKDVYPIEAEMLSAIKNAIKKNELSILSETKADQIGDQKDTKLPYYQQTKPTQ